MFDYKNLLLKTRLHTSSIACLAIVLISALPGAAQFKNRYTNLPSVTGFGAAGQGRPQQARPQQAQPARPQAAGGRTQPKQATGTGVYPEFRSAHGVIRWIPEQMPLKVWVSNGLSTDSILNPQLGAPYINVDHVNQWPGFVAQILQNPAQLGSLSQARGYVPEHRAAAIEGINFWKRFEKEGLFSFDFTDDPMEADIHVFFVHHFVGQQGMELFSSDIRGYTSKNCFPYKAIMEGKSANFQPVVILLRCTEKQRLQNNPDQPMPLAKMRAAAAHEFGHALGIDGHSKNPGDLMSMYYGNGVLSPGDIATIRYLYKCTPDLIP